MPLFLFGNAAVHTLLQRRGALHKTAARMTLKGFMQQGWDLKIQPITLIRIVQNAFLSSAHSEKWGLPGVGMHCPDTELSR